MNAESSPHVMEKSGAERLPHLDADRLFRRPSVFLWATFSYGAATWSFMTGGLLADYATPARALLAFLASTSLTMAVVVVGMTLPCAKYGIDMIDAVKAQFGTRGARLVMIVVCILLVGWGGVIFALGLAAVSNVTSYYNVAGGSAWVPKFVGFALLASIWYTAAHGARAFRSASRFVGPGLLLLAGAMLIILISRAGWGVFTKTRELAVDDPKVGIALIAEWGAAYGLSWWTAHAFARLSKGPRSAWVITYASWAPLQVGIVAVALLSSAYIGLADPTEWMIPMLGAVGGSAALLFIIVANWTSLTGVIYIVGVSLQQITAIQRVPWTLLTGLLTVPGGLALIFYPTWFIDFFPVFLAYNGILIAPIVTIQAVDYVLLRRQRLDVRSILADQPQNRYWFWGGYNWIAIGICVAMTGMYLVIFNPISLEAGFIFEHMTATIPVIVVSGILYFGLMKALIRAGVIRGYDFIDEAQWERANVRGKNNL